MGTFVRQQLSLARSTAMLLSHKCQLIRYTGKCQAICDSVPLCLASILV